MVWHEPCLHNKELNTDLSSFSMITEKKMLMQEAGLDIIDFSVEETAGHTGEVTNLGDSEDDLGEDSEGVAPGVTDRLPTTILPGKMVMKIMIRDMDFIINQVHISIRLSYTCIVVLHLYAKYMANKQSTVFLNFVKKIIGNLKINECASNCYNGLGLNMSYCTLVHVIYCRF